MHAAEIDAGLDMAGQARNAAEMDSTNGLAAAAQLGAGDVISDVLDAGLVR